MGRYYRRRYTRTIVRAPKRKWGSNMININLETVGSSDGEMYGYTNLAENKTEATSPTPIIIKTGNFKLQADFHFNIGSGGTGNNINATLYIIYVPQGITLLNYTQAEDLVRNHPEWIMAWRVLETETISAATLYNSNRVSVSSRLKRNLNSGDKVVALFIANNVGSSTFGYLRGKCQFWTCAN